QSMNCGSTRSDYLLASAPFVSGEYQPHSGSCALVQVKLRPQNERQEIDRSSRLLRADKASPRTLKAVNKATRALSCHQSPVTTDQSRLSSSVLAFPVT